MSHRNTYIILSALIATLLLCLWTTVFAQYRADAVSNPANFSGAENRLPGRDDPLGIATRVGITWYDYQANGTLSKQIAVDENGSVHSLWMNGLDNNLAGERQVWYNYTVNDGDNDPKPALDAGVKVNGDWLRAGYCNIAYSRATGPVAIYHANNENAAIAIWISADAEVGAGRFENPTVLPIGQAGTLAWPRGTVDRNGRVHVLAHPNPNPVDPTNLPYISAIMQDGQWDISEPAVITQTKGMVSCITSSPVSDKVSIVYLAPTYGQNEWARYQGGPPTAGGANNNVYYNESADGVEWDFENPVNATKIIRADINAGEGDPFYYGDTLRPNLYVDACYDFDDNLHIVFTASQFFENPDPNANPGYVANLYDEKRVLLYHWTSATDKISLIASGRYNTDGQVGAWRANLSNPSVGAAENGNIYCTWTQYPAEGDMANAAPNGLQYISGEVYASVSLDGGARWAEATNVTDTHSPNSNPGEAKGEVWSSLASIVTDHLHISYIFDLDPGGTPQNEGTATENPVMYHRVSVRDIATEPLIERRDFHIGAAPVIVVDPLDDIELIGIPDKDPVTAKFTITNDNDPEGGTALIFKIGTSDELVDVLSFEPAEGRLESQEAVEVTVSYLPVQVREDIGEIIITHNIGGVDPVIINFKGNGVPGFGTINGKVIDPSQDNIGIAEATVRLMPGNYNAVTGADGTFKFEGIAAFNFEAWVQAPTFLPYSGQIELNPDEQLDVEIPLFFGQMAINKDSIDFGLGIDKEADATFELSNEGNGEIRAYSSIVAFPENEPVGRFEERMTVDAEAICGDNTLQGAVFTGDYFYVSGGANNNANQSNIYILDRDGNKVDDFAQPGRSRTGMRDLAWDGALIWGGDGDTIYGINTEGALKKKWKGPFATNVGIAYDTDRQVLWISRTTSELRSFDVDGNLQQVIERPVGDVANLYGLAYYPGDADGYPVYIFSRTGDNNLHLAKMNPDDGSYREVGDLVTPAGMASGLEITTEYDPYRWTMVGLFNGSGAGHDLLTCLHLSDRDEWLTIEPGVIDLVPGEPVEVLLSIDVKGFPVGMELTANIIFTSNGRGEPITLPVSVKMGVGLGDHVMNIPSGWSLISAPMRPVDEDPVAMFRALVNENKLVMLKDNWGNYYSPAEAFNNIPGWSCYQGYQIKLKEAAEWTIHGEKIAVNAGMLLDAGWQIIPYFPDIQIPVEEVFGNREGAVIIVKDELGKFYVPEYEYNSMAPLSPNKGYRIKLSREMVLEYNPGDQVAALTAQPQAVHFAFSAQRNENMSLLITGIPVTISEVGAYNHKGQLISGSVRQSNGVAGLTIYCSEESENSGLADGERFTLKGWDGTAECEIEVEWLSGNGQYHTDALVVGKALRVSFTPYEFSLSSAYPNPFNSNTFINYTLPNAVDVQLALFDTNGRLVATLANGAKSAGKHIAVLNAVDLPSGIYYYRLSAGTDFAVRKVVLLK